MASKLKTCCYFRAYVILRLNASARSPTILIDLCNRVEVVFVKKYFSKYSYASIGFFTSVDILLFGYINFRIVDFYIYIGHKYTVSL